MRRNTIRTIEPCQFSLRLADWIISGLIGRFADHCTNKFYNQCVSLVDPLVFLLFIDD